MIVAILVPLLIARYNSGRPMWITFITQDTAPALTQKSQKQYSLKTTHVKQLEIRKAQDTYVRTWQRPCRQDPAYLLWQDASSSHQQRCPLIPASYPLRLSSLYPSDVRSVPEQRVCNSARGQNVTHGCTIICDVVLAPCTHESETLCLSRRYGQRS